jgi:hypothetical protein
LLRCHKDANWPIAADIALEPHVGFRGASITENFKSLYTHIRNEKLSVYHDAQMRDIATHVVFEESGSSLKLAKRQTVQKDYITALAMGCFMITQQQPKRIDLAHKYRAFASDFRDEDLPPLPSPQAPKRVEEIAYSLGDWWQTRPQEPYHSEADENLNRMCRALAGPPWKK